MPTIQTNEVETYYERRGEGPPLVFVHGAWVDHRLWNSETAVGVALLGPYANS